MTASPTMRVAAAVGVVNAVRIVRTRVVTMGELRGECNREAIGWDLMDWKTMPA